MLTKLHDIEVFSSWDAFLADVDRAGRTEWKSVKILELEGDEVALWQSCMENLKSNFIAIRTDEEDSLLWNVDDKNGLYTVRVGYLFLANVEMAEEVNWWWRFISKSCVPLKCKLTVWIALENKLLTWDNGTKRGWIGPNRCQLCKESEESIQHIFVECSTSIATRNLIAKEINIHNMNPNGVLIDWFHKWNDNRHFSHHMSVPFFFLYFIWWSRNSIIFQNLNILVEVVVGLTCKLTAEHKHLYKPKILRLLTNREIQEGVTWGVFYGACQGHPPRCGVGAKLHISKDHFHLIRYSPGFGTNNKAKLTALMALLFQAYCLHSRKLQVFGDSRVVIDWINGKVACTVRRIFPLLRQIKEFITGLEWFNCTHIYRELNEDVDRLSKEALELGSDAFVTQEYVVNNFIAEFNIRLCFHNHFFELQSFRGQKV